MDKILSVRVDESVIRRIGALAKQMGTTKKAVIEEAVHLYDEKVRSAEADVFERTLGAWSREESPQQTVAKVRRAFRGSTGRRHRRERQSPDWPSEESRSGGRRSRGLLC